MKLFLGSLSTCTAVLETWKCSELTCAEGRR